MCFLIDIYLYIAIHLLWGRHASRRGDLMYLQTHRMCFLFPLGTGKVATPLGGRKVLHRRFWAFGCPTMFNHFPRHGLVKLRFDASSLLVALVGTSVHARDNCCLCRVLLCLLPCCTVLLWYSFKGSWCLCHDDE